MSDDKDDEYDGRFFCDRDAQKLRRIKQRKGGCFFQVSSDDEDDRDDDYDSGISPDLNVQKLRHNKQRKEHCFIQFRHKVSVRTII